MKRLFLMLTMALVSMNLFSATNEGSSSKSSGAKVKEIAVVEKGGCNMGIMIGVPPVNYYENGEHVNSTIPTFSFDANWGIASGFAKTKRAFYHMRENEIPQGYDLLWRGTEITTGAQREHRYDILVQQALEKGLDKDVEFYLEFFKYGCPPHGGFGLGIDRLTMLLLGISTIKEAMFLFRGPNRLTP